MTKLQTISFFHSIHCEGKIIEYEDHWFCSDCGNGWPKDRDYTIWDFMYKSGAKL